MTLNIITILAYSVYCKKYFLSQFHAASHIYLHSLYGIYGIHGHLRSNRIYCTDEKSDHKVACTVI